MASVGAAWRLEPPEEEPGDEEIVRAVRAGAPERFEVLVRRHRARLRRLAGAVLRDRQEVEDAVQQAFLQAFAGLGRWTGAAAFATWLARIAVNEALIRSRRSRRAERAVRLLSALPDAGTPEQEAVWREAVARVEAALPRLPSRDREVLRLAAVDELPHADVAARLGVSPGAVKVRLHRARVALRGLVEERDDPRWKIPRREMPAPRGAARGTLTRFELPSG